MSIHKQFFILLLALFFVGCENSPQIESVPNPTSKNSSYPYLFSTGTDLYMSWITVNNDHTHTLHYARYTNGSWSEVNTIATDSTWFINWADFPSIVADNNGPIAAHWLNKKTGGPYAYDVNISLANDSAVWSNAVIPHNDNTLTEHGFASMIPWNKNTLLAVWLDGRQAAGRSDENYYNIDYAMTLRAALITKNGTIKEVFLIDDSVCDCCPTSLVKTESGALVAYRNRTDEEIRDIYASHFKGKSWSEPHAVHKDGWKIGACPVNGPKLAAQDSMVAISWHTGAKEGYVAQYAYSTDNGTTFSEPITLNDGTSLGRVNAAIYNGISYLSWMEKEDNETRLKVAAFDQDTRADSSRTVATIDESRKTGFPQME